MSDLLVTLWLVALIGIALFYTIRDIYWMFVPQKSPRVLGLRDGWHEGYREGRRDEADGRPDADNPFDWES